MLELDLPAALFLLPAPLLAWWLLPPWRERREAVRVPFFEAIAAAVGARPERGGVLLKRNPLQKILAPIVWL